MISCCAVITNQFDRCHIFYEARMIDIPDGLPKWSGMDNDSDRLDDQGNKIGSASQ